jgi:hypothetical protein
MAEDESIYTQSIISRLNNPELQKENNPFRIVLDGTVGEYLENYDNHIYDLFLTRAKGGYLDRHGEMYGLYRRENEDDDSFRKRILLEEFIVQSTADFLSLDAVLWVYFTDILDKNVLSSRNPYLKGMHDDPYVFLATGSDSEYIQSKFFVGDILWVP